MGPSRDVIIYDSSSWIGVFAALAFYLCDRDTPEHEMLFVSDETTQEERELQLHENDKVIFLDTLGEKIKTNGMDKVKEAVHIVGGGQQVTLWQRTRKPPAVSTEHGVVMAAYNYAVQHHGLKCSDDYFRYMQAAELRKMDKVEHAKDFKWGLEKWWQTAHLDRWDPRTINHLAETSAEEYVRVGRESREGALRCADDIPNVPFSVPHSVFGKNVILFAKCVPAHVMEHADVVAKSVAEHSKSTSRAPCGIVYTVTADKFGVATVVGAMQSLEEFEGWKILRKFAHESKGDGFYLFKVSVDLVGIFLSGGIGVENFDNLVN